MQSMPSVYSAALAESWAPTFIRIMLMRGYCAVWKMFGLETNNSEYPGHNNSYF